MKILIFFIFALLLINLASAENITISNNPVTLKFYNNTFQVISRYDINNKNYTFTNNLLVPANQSGENLSCFVPSQEFTFDNYFLQNITTSIDLTINDRLINCEIEKATLNSSFNSYQNNNAFSCNISLIQKDSDLKLAKDAVGRLTADSLAKTNEKYLWGVLGLALGVVGYMFFTGKIGRNVRDKSEEEFQRNLAR